MSNVTNKDLKARVKAINFLMLASGSNWYFVEQGRNGYQAVDLYSVRSNGSITCEIMVGGGSSREVISYLESSYYDRVNTRSRHQLTREAVKRLFMVNGLDFDDDYHKTSFGIKDELITFGKLTNYKCADNGKSYCHNFFNNLAKKAVK